MLFPKMMERQSQTSKQTKNVFKHNILMDTSKGIPKTALTLRQAMRGNRINLNNSCCSGVIQRHETTLRRGELICYANVHRNVHVPIACSTDILNRLSTNEWDWDPKLLPIVGQICNIKKHLKTFKTSR